MFTKSTNGVFALMLVLAISAFGLVAMTTANESQAELSADLTSYNAADASAYRWNAIARFYEAKNNSQNNLASFNAADASAYNWSAITRFYDAQKERLGSLSGEMLVNSSPYGWNALVNTDLNEILNPSQSSMSSSAYLNMAHFSAYGWNAQVNASFSPLQNELTYAFPPAR